jgi:cation diffusion facilitator family transporter
VSESTREIVKSLVANVLIACAKAFAAVITSSGAMLAETLHSFADCGNELLLLRGVHSAKRPPDPRHPLGYGRAMYFYAFVVALLLFTGGGVFSIHEGVHKIRHPEPIDQSIIAYIILGLSFLLEGYALFGNLREIKKRRGDKSLYRYMRDTKDSDLIVVTGENMAAVLGLVLAISALLLARQTGDPRWDGAGSLAIGLVLVGVATFLARETKSLLVGEAADPVICEHVREIAAAMPNIVRVIHTITLQQGPGEIVVAAKIQLKPGLDTEQVVDTINALERDLKFRAPEVRWSFVEPDDAD